MASLGVIRSMRLRTENPTCISHRQSTIGWPIVPHSMPVPELHGGNEWRRNV